MIIERVLEAVLFVVAAKTAIALFSAPDEPALVLGRRLSRRRLPVAAIVITTALIAGCLLEVAWPGALSALRTGPASAWWQVFTAPFVQDGGVAGALFNIVSAAIIVALAEWQWGRLIAAVIWLTAAWAPIGHLAGLAGYHVSAANATAYTAGSSGATYFTAGSPRQRMARPGPAAARRLPPGLRRAGLSARPRGIGPGITMASAATSVAWNRAGATGRPVNGRSVVRAAHRLHANGPNPNVPSIQHRAV